MKTLLIEDNPADVELLKIAFEQTQIDTDIIVKTDGQEAIDYLFELAENQPESEFPSLIFLDLNLPKKSGKEVLRLVKKDEKLRGVPIIVMSTSDFREDVELCYKLYANSYLVKPSDFSMFMDMVGSIKEFWYNKSVLP
ncbi:MULTISPECIES: response regulator [Roseivirga]|uniref:Response regulator n=1 Tax=Roseivirga thermotolerans TaxID=1758176 RepID=A0ABQ3IAZ1_9BACT|nr:MULTISPECIES: response regulator [Roseivirga]MEC7754845.1 response regulator [Bacteroidota bacterium]GHE69147.1 response regulator [Roseivirga thermotolerans]